MLNVFSLLFSPVILLAFRPSHWPSVAEVAESHHCPHRLTGWEISVASVSPEDCVEVKQLSVAEGHEAGADSGEVRLTGSYYTIHCPQTEVPASSVTLQFLIRQTDLIVSRNPSHCTDHIFLF